MLKTPKYPEDFKSLHSDGGFYYQHWHPDAPPEYDGTWPAGEDPPHYSAGIWVFPDEDHENLVIVWEFSPDTESGPVEIVPADLDEDEIPFGDPVAMQAAVDRVVAEVNRQGSFGS